MMSTPISSLRTREAAAAESSPPGADAGAVRTLDETHDSSEYVPDSEDEAADEDYIGARGDDDEDEDADDVLDDDDACSNGVCAPPSTRRRGLRGSNSAARESARPQRANRRGPKSTLERLTSKTARVASIWKGVFSLPFLQAIAMAFAIIIGVSLSPAADLALQRVPMLARLPRAETVVCAFVSAVLVTACRPPMVAT